MDDYNFNDCVNLSEFDHTRTLSFIPPDGEFVVLNYRTTGEFKVPFRIFPAVEETAPDQFEITLMIRAEMPDNHFGSNVTIEIPLPPHSTTSASCQILTNNNNTNTGVATPASAEYVSQDKKIVWYLKKFAGSSEQSMKAKVTLNSTCTSQIRKQIGPINMNFEIPMYNVSNLQVRYLRIAEAMAGYTPYRWVRYVTQSSSYICRL